MSLMDQLRRALQGPTPAPTTGLAPATMGATDDDQRAVERYRYLLRTASPDDPEQVHAEAFAQLAPAQRRQVLDGLTENESMTPAQRHTLADDPRSLARIATR
jgi:hypothetical protein